MSKKDLELETVLNLDFSKLSQVAEKCPDVIPVVVQDWQSGEVLILAYANKEALGMTLATRKAFFWSTSRNELWLKGETSDCIFRVIEVRVNCDQNSLLYLVEPEIIGTGACHVKDEQDNYYVSCYYRRIVKEDIDDEYVNRLAFIKTERRVVK